MAQSWVSSLCHVQRGDDGTEDGVELALLGSFELRRHTFPRFSITPTLAPQGEKACELGVSVGPSHQRAAT